MSHLPIRHEEDSLGEFILGKAHPGKKEACPHGIRA